ncbi:hypothetical protein LWI28_006185 [Acer negundo]|uniref:Uncharacterized protein n=1 Tax=Acer negundo TaxID=4023 RepID=A0AAD5J439_ACENE|nr:hypothetical protein LWI28_006185 [Acer negundo]
MYGIQVMYKTSSLSGLCKGKGVLSNKQAWKPISLIVHNWKIVLDKNSVLGFGGAEEGDDIDSSYFEDREDGFLSHFPSLRGEPFIVNSAQLKGGQIVIDLGVGLGKERNCYTKKDSGFGDPNLDTSSGRNLGKLDSLHVFDAANNVVPVYEQELRLSFSDFSASYISETQF